MSDPFELVIGAVGAIFGAGVAYASMRSEIKAVKIASETARQQADDALTRIGVERERTTRQDGLLGRLDERVNTLRRDVDMVWPAVFKSRAGGSEREMPAVQSRRDLPRQDSDPVPPPRPRLGSVRRGDT